MKPRKITIKTKEKEIKSFTIDAKHQREIDKKVKEETLNLDNVLFKCSKPYKKEQSYIKADFSTILSDEYMTYERNYPEIFRLISGESGVRASFYEYMEEMIL